MAIAWFIEEKIVTEFIIHRYYMLEPFFNGCKTIVLSRSDLDKSIASAYKSMGWKGTLKLRLFEVEFMAFPTDKDGSSNELFCLREDVSFEECLKRMGYDEVKSFNEKKLNDITSL